MSTKPIPEALLELRCWTREAVDRLGLRFDGDRVVLPVRDEVGELLGHLRYHPNGGNPKMLADAGCSRELFPPPETIGPDEGDGWLWLVEGEPDAVRAWSLGVVAVGVPGTQGWKPEWAPRFTGRKVAICFDADEGGRMAAARVGSDLAAAGIAAHIVDLTPVAESPGFDLTDFTAKARSSEEREEVRRILVGMAELAPLAPVLEPEGETPEPEGTTPPEHTWRRLDLIELGSREPKPPDLGGLLYSGRRHVVSGEDDAGKTMLLLGISSDELRSGRGVVWIDTDDMGASPILERLRAFGVDDDVIRKRFAYLRPEEALTDAARDDVIALMRELAVRLMVSDAFNAALTLHGYSPRSTEEVEAFWQRVVAPFCHQGAAVVLPDHVVKEKEARGRYAYGSERKATGCDVHLGLRVIEAFGRGRRGRAKITVHRDRIGFLEKPSPGLFVLDSDPDTGRLGWTIEESGRVHGDEFRPDEAHGEGEPLPRGVGRRSACADQIESGVKGKTDYKRLAIDLLLREEYAVEFPGAHGARLVKHVRPYREADQWTRSEAES